MPDEIPRPRSQDLASTSRLEFRILGPLQVCSDGRPISVGGPRQRAVLATLLLSPDRVVSVDSLIENVWSGSPPSTGRTQVAICVATLRKLFRAAGCDDEVIVTAAPGYMFRTQHHLLDTVEFSRLVDRSGAQARNGKVAEAASLLREALALWRGPALSGISASFAEMEAMRLDEERMHAVERCMSLRLELGEHDTVLGELTALVRARPLRDRLRSYLMLAQYRSGRRAEALKTFREGSRHSIDELGLELSTELQELHDLILRDESPDLAPPALPAEPARVWTPPAQLPSNIPTFVGREPELRALNEVLLDRSGDGPVAVGCIVGSPGIGKTGLAVHWAHKAAAQFTDGQLFADLQENGQPLHAREVLHRFLRALGVTSERIPGDVGECAALYRSMLDGRRVLIVLDNATDFAQLRLLLPGNGMCCVLVTGRDGLNELMDSYDTLRIRLGALEPDQATAMLGGVVRDARVTGNPEAARRLATLCGHVPLALRAAGARLVSKQHWTADDLVLRLQDAKRRLDELSHGGNSVRIRFDRSLKGLDFWVAHAYHRLSSIEARDFDVAAAAQALATTPAEAEELIERLVDAQLLEVAGRDQRGRVRYFWQELLRFHAKESWVLPGPWGEQAVY